MKVLHINASANKGGAAKACKRLNDALIKNGVDSAVLTIQEQNKKEHVHALNTSGISRFRSFLTFGLEMLLVRLLVKKNTVPFSFSLFGTDITDHLCFKNADIIHLHWINHGFLNTDALQKITASSKKIVWTFHDSWASTGGCHVKAGCTNYLLHCNHCPVINSSIFENYPSTFFHKKQQLFASNKINIVTPSAWLANEISKSDITKNSPVQNIANPIDTGLFKPMLKNQSDTLKVLIGFMKINASGHKGFDYALEGLRILKQKRPDLNIELEIFGCNEEDLKTLEIPFKHQALGFIRDEQGMINAYCNADVYIAPFLEDNFPNTVLEAMSCGTPVIGFNAGGIPEMVKHLENGFLAESRSSESIAEGIAFMLNAEQRNRLAANARKYVEQHFSETVIAQKFKELYTRI